MKFEFQNGSVIETVDSSSGNIRSKVKGYVDRIMTEVVICNSEGCSNNTYGTCSLPEVGIRDGECESFRQIDVENSNG